MGVAQLIASSATLFERKLATIDRRALGGRIVTQWSENREDQSWRSESGTTAADAKALGGIIRDQVELLHIYGSPVSALLKETKLPYVASSAPSKGGLPWSRIPQPRVVVSPEGEVPIPEAVDQAYLDERWIASPKKLRVIASISRPSIESMRDRTLVRLHRFRDDVEWWFFDGEPTLAEMLQADAWVDPATEDDDRDGWTAEALALGIPVIASRTSINVIRTEDGRAGRLVPKNDPNELVHHILNALFKPESVEAMRQEALEGRDRFAPERRAEALTRLYERALM